MSYEGGRISFDMALSTQSLRRDAQAAMRQFNMIGQQATRTGLTVDASMSSLARGVNNVVQKMTKGIADAMSELSKNALGISALISSGAFLKGLYDESKEFSKQMRIVSTISDEVTKDMAGYKQQVLDLCKQIAVAPDTAAAALYQINSAGHLGADGMKVLEASAKSAVGGVTETATAADAITTILNAYKMSADEAEAISDKLFTTVRLGKTTMGELGQSISVVAPLAARYKISIDEVLAAVAQLTKQGTPTAAAMTQISAGITAIANELGDDAFKNGLMAGFEEIEKRANGSNMALRAQLSNIRAVRSAMSLTGESAAETAEMIEQIKNSAGSAEEACKKLNSLGGAEIRKLKTNFLDALQGIGDGMTKTLGSLARTLNSAFESGSMQQVLSTLKDLIITYGIYKALIVVLKTLNSAYAATMRQVRLAQIAAAIEQKSLNTAQALGVVITNSLKTAVQKLWAALKANKFTLIIAAIAAAGYAIYKFITRTSEAEKRARELAAAMAKVAQEAKDEKKKVYELLNTLKTTKQGTEEFKKAKQQLIDQYGQYISKVINERGEITNLGEAYRILTNEINAAARARALEQLNQDATDTLTESNKDASKDMAKYLIKQGLSENEADAVLKRISMAMSNDSAIPQDIYDNYGLGVNYVYKQIESRLNDTQRSTFEKLTNGKKYFISAAELGTLLDNLSILPKERYGLFNDTSRYNFQSAVDNMRGNFKTYEKTLKKNEIYAGMSTFNPELFAGVDPKNYAALLSHLKKDAKNMLINQPIKNLTRLRDQRSGVFVDAYGLQHSFATVEDLNAYIDQLEMLIEGDKSANALGSGGEGGASDEIKTVTEQIADMISQSRTAEKASDINQLLEKMKDMLDKGDINVNSQEYANLKTAYKALKNRAPGASDGNGETPAQLSSAVDAALKSQLELLDSQKRERIRAEEDAQFEIDEAAIEAITDGAEKRRKQQEFEFRKQETELKREHEDAVLDELERQKSAFAAQEEVREKQAKQQGNKNYAKQIFSDADIDQSEIDKINSRYEKMLEQLHAKQAKASRENSLEELSAMREYLKQYGSFEQQKLTLTQEYEEKIRKAETQGERLMLEKEKAQALSALTFENISMGIDWSALLGDIGHLSKKMLEPMLKQLEAYLRTPEYNNATLQDREKVNELINELRQYVATDQSTTWKGLADAINAFTAGVNRYKEIERQEKNAMAAWQAAKARFEKGEITEEQLKSYEAAANALSKQTAEAKNEMQNLGQTLNETSDKVAGYVSPLTAALNKAGTWKGVGGFEGVQGSIGQLDQLKGALDSALPLMGEGLGQTIGTSLSTTLGSALSSIGGNVTSLLSTGVGSVVGIIAQIPQLILNVVSSIKSMVTGFFDSLTELVSLRWIDDLIVGILDSIGNLIDTIFDLPENLYHVIEGVIVDGVGGLLNSIIGRIGNILSFGLLSSSGPASWFTNSNAKEVQDTIDRLTNRNATLQTAIEDLTEEMEKSSGAKSILNYNEAYALQKETEENYKAMAQAQAGYHGSHRSWNHYWKGFTQDEIEKFSKQIGRSWNGDIWNLSPEEMKKLRANVEMWEKIINTGKGNYGGRLGEKLDDYIDQAGTLKELTDSLYESLTGITFDSMHGSYIDMLMDMGSRTDDFADDLKEKFTRAMLTFKIDELQSDSLKEWWGKFGEAMKDDGELSERERKELYDDYMSYVQEGLKIRDNIAAVTGYDSTATQQGGSRGGFTAMSQDDAGEMNGRLTGIQMDVMNIRETQSTLAVSISGLAVSAVEIKQHTEEMRNISLLAIDHLSAISKHTAHLEEMNERLGKIERYTSRL